jgi:hypothetical protein
LAGALAFEPHEYFALRDRYGEFREIETLDFYALEAGEAFQLRPFPHRRGARRDRPSRRDLGDRYEIASSQSFCRETCQRDRHGAVAPPPLSM